jgi:hypothetical protein
MIGNLNFHEIDQILRTQQIGRLGLARCGRLYIFPLAYGYDGTAIYAASRDDVKTRLMRAQPEVCFEVADITSPARWCTVLVHGTDEELTEAADRDAALAVIAAQGGHPLLPSKTKNPDGTEAIVVYRINVAEVTGRFEQEPAIPFAGRRPASLH